jgi:hypothetical protein
MGNKGVYNLGYYEGMLKNYSMSAEKICEIRWDFVKEAEAKTVLDYGCGVGWFRAFRPNGLAVDSFDVADFPQTGINHIEYDLICFWDVLEHIDNFTEIEALLHKAKYVAATFPIAPDGQDMKTWKHFKPGEHLHYFTEASMVALFDRYGFELVKKGTPECPPRQDVWSFLFKKKPTYIAVKVETGGTNDG